MKTKVLPLQTKTLVFLPSTRKIAVLLGDLSRLQRRLYCSRYLLGIFCGTSAVQSVRFSRVKSLTATSCPSVLAHVSTWPPRDGFTSNLILETLRNICHFNKNVVKNG